MNDQLAQLLENYKDGVPVKIERQSIALLCAAELLTVVLGAIIVKFVGKL